LFPITIIDYIIFTKKLAVDWHYVCVLTSEINHFNNFCFFLHSAIYRCSVILNMSTYPSLVLVTCRILYQLIRSMTIFPIKVKTCQLILSAHVVALLLNLLSTRLLCGYHIFNSFQIFLTCPTSLNQWLESSLHIMKSLYQFIICKCEPDDFFLCISLAKKQLFVVTLVNLNAHF
jgi:hypothetical protein